jgi:hypothetical protein
MRAIEAGWPKPTLSRRSFWSDPRALGEPPNGKQCQSHNRGSGRHRVTMTRSYLARRPSVFAPSIALLRSSARTSTDSRRSLWNDPRGVGAGVVGTPADCHRDLHRDPHRLSSRPPSTSSCPTSSCPSSPSRSSSSPSVTTTSRRVARDELSTLDCEIGLRRALLGNTELPFLVAPIAPSDAFATLRNCRKP